MTHNWLEIAVVGLIGAVAAGGCARQERASGAEAGQAAGAHAAAGGAAKGAAAKADVLPVIERAAGTARPPFAFSDEDSKFLEEVQRGSFNYLWNGAVPESGMVPDRSSNPTVSTAGVGFQLAAIPVGVERGWITRAQGEERALLIMRTLMRDPQVRTHGLYQHFVDGHTGGPHTHEDLESVVSTVDSAWLFCGAIVAGEYFGGEIARRANEMMDEADWKAFIYSDPKKPYEAGFISLGWKSDDPKKPGGTGKILPYSWVDSGCEHRAVAFLAACAPREEHRVGAEHYYRLRRGLGEYKDAGTMVFFPWSGALFTYFFSHCFMDYAAMGVDDPAAFGIQHRARVDWWENSRRYVHLHRIKCIEASAKYKTFGENAWGLTASDGPKGYLVPGVFPNAIAPSAWGPGARAEWDYSTYKAKDDFGDGTIAPYAAACSIMFEPKLSIAAMRHMRELKDSSGRALAWRDPANGGYGFVDSYNLSLPGGPWAAPDTLAIDAGPKVLAIENARTGLIWKLFHQNEHVKAGMERLKLVRQERGKGGSK